MRMHMMDAVVKHQLGKAPFPLPPANQMISDAKAGVAFREARLEALATSEEVTLAGRSISANQSLERALVGMETDIPFHAADEQMKNARQMEGHVDKLSQATLDAVKKTEKQIQVRIEQNEELRRRLAAGRQAAAAGNPSQGKTFFRECNTRVASWAAHSKS